MIQVGILAGLLAGLVVLLIGLLSPRRSCPNCGVKLPRFRLPKSGKQAASGGWTCSGCGVEIDRSGRLISFNKSAAPMLTDVQEASKFCPRCAERIQIEALVCTHCGQEFTAADVQEALEKAERQAQLAKQAAQERAAQEQRAKITRDHLRRAKAYKIIGGLVALVGALLTIIFTFYTFSEQAASAAQTGGLLAAIAPLLCSLPVLTLGIWLLYLGKKKRVSAVAAE